MVSGVTAAAASPAAAQIYTWHDAEGRLVLSNIRPGAAAERATYGVPETEAVGTTRDVAAQGRRFDHLIEAHASQSGIREDLVRAVIQVESAFNPYAVSNKEAMGLMQLMPATAREFGAVNPFDPSQII